MPQNQDLCLLKSFYELLNSMYLAQSRASLVAQLVKNLPAM